jgi:hypothetical protein
MGRWWIRAAVAALIALAGCGGCGETEKPPSRSSASVPRTGGPATSPAALEADGYVVVPRTNVALRPPDGFVVVPSLPGLGRVGTRSAFVVTQGARYKDSDAAVDEIESSFRDDAEQARQGFQFDWVERFSIDGRPAVGAVGTQTADGMIFNKAVAAFVSEGFLVTLSATLDIRDPVAPVDALDVMREARWSTRAGPAGFAITPALGYAKRASSAALCYALEGHSGWSAPQFLVRSSMGERTIAPAARRDTTRALFRALPGNPAVDSERRVAIAGLPGWELTGTGKAHGRDLTLYMTMLFTDGDSLALVGSFDPDRYDDQIDAFRAMAHSFAFTG